MTGTETLILIIGIAAAAVVHALHRVADAVNNLFLDEEKLDETAD